MASIIVNLAAHLKIVWRDQWDSLLIGQCFNDLSCFQQDTRTRSRSLYLHRSGRFRPCSTVGSRHADLLAVGPQVERSSKCLYIFRRWLLFTFYLLTFFFHPPFNCLFFWMERCVACAEILTTTHSTTSNHLREALRKLMPRLLVIRGAYKSTAQKRPTT